ncbi:hypothetical protein Emed_005263 [Eimeria media]
MTVASRLLAAALLLASSSSPLYEEEGALSAVFKGTTFGVVLAAANGDMSDDDETVSEERQREKADDNAEDEAAAPETEGKATPGSLRGSAASKEKKDPAAARKELANVFEGLLQSLSPEKESALLEHSKQAQKLNELLDVIFPPRLQTAPRYMGALESLNESLYRDVLRGPGKESRSPALLQQAYSYLRKPPLVLVVPALFIELREGADRYRWEEEKRLIHRRCERTGESVPPRYELSADEVHAQEIDDGALWDEEIAPEDLSIRIHIIHGWLKEQYRLRLYYRKRMGLLKGNPQDLMTQFNPGPDLLPVSIEDIEGLSYAAELEDAPLTTDEEAEGVEHSKSKEEEVTGEAQQSEL